MGPGARLTETMQRLERSLRYFAEGLVTLEVRTYVAGDMDLLPGDLERAAALRAVTRLQQDGDVQMSVPERDGKVDERLYRLHMEAVGLAQDGRAAMLQAAITATKRLLGQPEEAEEAEEPQPDGGLEGVIHRVV